MAATYKGVLGIDFGTSTTILAKSDGTAVSTIPLDRSQMWLPSVVGRSSERWLVGEEAENLPFDHLVRSVKNSITNNEDVVADGDLAGVSTDEVVEAILARVALMAERNGVDVEDALVRMGCPACWVGSQRMRLANLSQRAGLPVEVDHMIDEPIGAGIEWVWDRYLNHHEKVRGKVLVVDYGGGTLDVALLDVDFGDQPVVTVLSARGRAGAGDDLDERIGTHLSERFVEAGVSSDRVADPSFSSALARESRAAKVRLSDLAATDILLGASFRDIPRLTLSRSQLEDAFAPQLNETMVEIRNCIREARLRDSQGFSTAVAVRHLPDDTLAADIKYVLLAGGMSLVPAVREELQRNFPHAKVYGDQTINDVTTKVARGFAREDEYHSLNLHRPGLDLVLKWSGDDGKEQEELLYEAFRPIYERYQLVSNAPLRFERKFHTPHGSNPKRARIEARTVGGTQLAIKLQTHDQSDRVMHDGIPVTMNHWDPVGLKLDVNGEIWITDGTGQTSRLHVARWPYVRFKRDHSMIGEIEMELKSSGEYWGVFPYPHK